MEVYLATLGCRLNEAEVEGWMRQLDARGHRVVERAEEAGLVVLNTCAVTAEAAKKSRQLARRLHRQNPSARLVLTGCFASLEPEEAAGLVGVDRVIPNAEKDRLVDHLEEVLALESPPRLAQDPEEEPVWLFRPSHARAFVKVQDGCRNKCSFCIVTVARGEERSRSVESLCEEVQRRVEEGHREVVLTGVHIGGYGHELGTDLRGLIEALLERTGVERLRLGSLEPWDLPEGFFELWSDPRLCPHLHLPLQSGSDGVLRRMRRRTTRARFTALVEAARASIPNLNLTSDLIVGFPGESEAEWAETAELLEVLRFAHLHVFTFSPRAGTHAATLPGRVAPEVQRARSQAAHAAAARHRAEFLASQVGLRHAVLWEGRGVEEPDGSQRWSGYTSNYLRAEARFAEARDRRGEIAWMEGLEVVGEGLRVG